MNLPLINLPDDNQKPQTTPTKPSQESITPEKIYKGFEEWRRLGRQDTTEPQVPSKDQDKPDEKK